MPTSSSTLIKLRFLWLRVHLGMESCWPVYRGMGIIWTRKKCLDLLYTLKIDLPDRERRRRATNSSEASPDLYFWVYTHNSTCLWRGTFCYLKYLRKRKNLLWYWQNVWKPQEILPARCWGKIKSSGRPSKSFLQLIEDELHLKKCETETCENTFCRPFEHSSGAWFCHLKSFLEIFGDGLWFRSDFRFCLADISAMF